MPDRWGIEAHYTDALGNRRACRVETIEDLRRPMGANEYPEGPPRTDSVLVVREHERPSVGHGRVALEKGGELAVTGRLPDTLPLGYHTLRSEEAPDRLLIVSPEKCFLAQHARAWGWAVQLYGARCRQSWGIGDFADLRRLARWTAGLGGGFLLTNPLHASTPTGRQHPSPYFPASRRFLSPLYLCIDEIPGVRELRIDVDRLAAAGRRLNEQRYIDRDEVWRLKREALEMIWSHPARAEDARFQAWCLERGTPLAEFATWCTLTERYGARWRDWPPALRHPASSAVSQFAASVPDRVRFWSWVQWLCHTQLATAGQALMHIQDLPVGFDPDGADAWTFRDLLADGVTVGAPPDEFNTHGQNWGLPPFVPWRLRDAAYRPFIETIRATMIAKGGVRIDHVMGLSRLWWIPSGAAPPDGAYVRYPADELVAIVALESSRAQTLVVGEDLGTVDPGFRDQLHRRGVLSYRLLWFEEDHPSSWPPQALAAVTTHDLPTVAGLWSGQDLEQQARFGLSPNAGSRRKIRDRLARDARLDGDAPAAEAVHRAHRLLAQAPCQLLSATLEDAVAEPERPNMPGADAGRRNWQLALSVPLDELEHQPLPRRVGETLHAAVRGGTAANHDDSPPRPRPSHA